MTFFCIIFNFIVSMYAWMIIVAILMTYFRPDPYNKAVQFIYKYSAPALNIARKYLPFLVIEGIDFSPIVIILALQLLPQLICSMLF